jgi:hypothetical protein
MGFLNAGDFDKRIFARWRCGLRYRASESRNARVSYWHILTYPFWIGLPLVPPSAAGWQELTGSPRAHFQIDGPRTVALRKLKLDKIKGAL